MPIAAGGASPRQSAPFEPPAAGQAPARLPIVGRDGELTEVLAAHRSATPDGRVVAVVGEAGIGKSRLVEAVEEAVTRAGGHTLVARAFATESGIAYGSVVELLRSGLAQHDAAERLHGLPPVVLSELERLVVLPDRLAGRVPRPVPGVSAFDLAAARARLLAAIADGLVALVSGPVPGLVVVEDLQWADDASREVLGYLARRLAGRSIVVLHTWRPEDLDDRGAGFAAAVEGLPGALVLTPGRLGREAVARLVAAATAAGRASPDPDKLLGDSEGLPLYVVEALAAGTGGPDGPARSVRALLRERIANVGETAAQVLSAAAVIGRSFDLSILRTTSGRSEEETLMAVEELVRRGVVRELHAGGTDAFDFAHAKLRDAAYEGTSLARRRLLHRRTAGRDDAARVARVAPPARAAGRDAEAAEAFREAGARARAVYANHEALDHLETALALGHPAAIELQVAIGELRTTLGDYAGAIAALEAAAALADEGQLDGGDRLSAVELRLGRVHARRGDLATAISHLDAALAGLATGPPAASDRPRGGLAARILVERSVVALRAGDPDRATAAARDALGHAEAVGDVPAAGAATRVLGLIARERGDLPAARAALMRSVELATDDPDPGAAIAAGNALALVEAATGDRVGAIVRLQAVLELCRRTGDRHLEAAVENNLADQLHAAGRADEAMEHLKRAVASFAEVGGRPGELEPEIWKLIAW
jgi:tetratricopeptide (TPR) repeat protein